MVDEKRFARDVQQQEIVTGRITAYARLLTAGAWMFGAAAAMVWVLT